MARMCLRRGRVWPGDPRICGRCGQGGPWSFRGRLCGAKSPHLNPPAAGRCLTCGLPMATAYAPSLPLTPLLRIATWALVGLGLRWAYRHAGEIAGHAWAAVRWGAAWFLDIPPQCVDYGLTRLGAHILVALLLLYLIPGSAGKAVRATVFRIARIGAGLLVSLLYGLFRLLRLLVEGYTSGQKRGGTK